MIRQRKLIKSTYTEINGVKVPDFTLPHKIVSRPSGNCPYFILKTEEEVNQEDIITDSAEFLSQYDLSEGDEQMQLMAEADWTKDVVDLP